MSVERWMAIFCFLFHIYKRNFNFPVKKESIFSIQRKVIISISELLYLSSC